MLRCCIVVVLYLLTPLHIKANADDLLPSDFIMMTMMLGLRVYEYEYFFKGFLLFVFFFFVIQKTFKKNIKEKKKLFITRIFSQGNADEITHFGFYFIFEFFSTNVCGRI